MTKHNLAINRFDSVKVQWQFSGIFNNNYVELSTGIFIMTVNFEWLVLICQLSLFPFQVTLSVILTAAGVIIAALGDFSFDLFGYSMALISVFFQVGSLPFNFEWTS